ncbi:MAG: DNA topoisomerase IV subunit A [Bacilli bacterium]|nr:DNA topoisomerase IV subunit A [Bacilli bacterium]
MKDVIQKIYEYSLEEIMGERFGRYSKYIIQDRAIPDVRDGLKPVQRRILYSMYKEKNTFEKPYRKSARSVGDIMGKYHPHGDSSIYDALVRLSQWWKSNTPFVDMHGNNGSIDGDSPAAMRYTEARLSKIAGEMLKDIDKDTVVFAPNYDDSLLEPTILPARFPNLLVNGATGISAGYATNIPPHNLGEVIDATIYRIEYPNSKLETIMNIIKGPDFPTGGIVEGIDGIRKAYESGKGKIIIKSKVRVETVKGKTSIIIDEIPFEVNKAMLVKSIDEIRVDKKIDGMVEIRDESDREGIRIVIDVKKDANTDLILNYLYKNTELQVSYGFNMIGIESRRPKLLGLLDMLDAYIAHKKEVTIKKNEFDLLHAEARMHIVEGLIKAISILDEVIATIRSSKNRADSEANLVAKFGFTEKQAKAIVELQLYRLSNTDITELQEEMKNLGIIINTLRGILNDEEKLKGFMKDELKKIKKEYATDRKTEIKDEITEINIDKEDLIPKEDVVVVVTKEGYVKRVSLRSYSSSKDEDTSMKDGDYVIGMYEVNTTDTILMFTNLGNYLYVPVYELPDSKWKELGKHISNIIPLREGEEIISSIPVYDFDKEMYITTFTKMGMIKRTLLSDYKLQRYSKPVVNIKLKEEDVVVDVTCEPYNNALIVTNTGYSLMFNMSEVPVTGIKSAGVKSIKLKDDYVVSGLLLDGSFEHIAIITNKGTAKRLRISDIEMSARARRGMLIIREVKTNPHRVLRVFKVKKELIGIKNNNDIDFIKNTEMPIMDRLSTGSNIAKSITDAFIVKGMENKNSMDVEVVEKVITKESISLEEIDNKILTIDDFLKDFNS